MNQLFNPVILVAMLVTGNVLLFPAETWCRTPDLLFGNIYGTVTDTENGKPLVQAGVYLFDHPTRGLMLPDEFSQAIRQVVTDARGYFLLSGIPVQGTMTSIDLIIVHEDLDPVIIHGLQLLPGASMALNVDTDLTSGYGAQQVDGASGAPNVRINYRHRLRHDSSPQMKIPPRAAGNASDLTVFATREGLVGFTTANGHVIEPRDHFVALPYTEVLSSEGGSEFQVELSYNGRVVIAPVWDLGPWNVHDNYWAADEKREIYDHLFSGGQYGGLAPYIPQAQAAFEDNFNSGMSEFDALVKNPAGIDLADGTFWDDLELTDNAWIRVRFLWITDGTLPPDSEEDDDRNRAFFSVGCFIDRLLE